MKTRSEIVIRVTFAFLICFFSANQGFAAESKFEKLSSLTCEYSEAYKKYIEARLKNSPDSEVLYNEYQKVFQKFLAEAAKETSIASSAKEIKTFVLLTDESSLSEEKNASETLIFPTAVVPTEISTASEKVFIDEETDTLPVELQNLLGESEIYSIDDLPSEKVLKITDMEDFSKTETETETEKEIESSQNNNGILSLQSKSAPSKINPSFYTNQSIVYLDFTGEDVSENDFDSLNSK
ncbi:MAG: hypothetical protein HQM10_03315 [Candidatus Riflebacteria bacterium]|nr:hypothetical protein [Candidatus Riflebacteria bacterium]